MRCGTWLGGVQRLTWLLSFLSTLWRGESVDCNFDVDSGGDNCSFYDAEPQFCGCCETPCFQSHNCRGCQQFVHSPGSSDEGWWWTTVFHAWPRKATSLRLEGKGLRGSLPADFGHRWPRLVEVSLGQNALSGTLPPSLGLLVNLTTLRIEGNALTGKVPAELGRLERLNRLSLERNRLNGSIPAELGLLWNLETLGLQDNQLSGSIPAELGRLTRLSGDLNLENNLLSGSIPAELGRLVSLEGFVLGHNRLTGNIPRELGQLSGVRNLDLSDNQLSGSIPAELGLLPNLLLLTLADNQLTGSVPPTFGQSGLTTLVLKNNQLSGSLPAELGQMRRLMYLLLEHNHFSGPIPATFGDLGLLQVLHLQHNRVNGSIPAELGQLKRLSILDLRDNHLSGSIPKELGGCVILRLLHLNDNELSGSLPAELGSLFLLEQVHLPNNRLAGGIPPSYGALFNLEELDVSQNPDFCGNVDAISDMHRLQDLRLRGCCLQHIPRLPARLEHLDLGGNRLTVFPENMLELPSVRTILLNNNSIELWHTDGVVPVSMFGPDGIPVCGYHPPGRRLAWPKLERLEVTANQLRNPIYDFLVSLSHLPELKVVRAQENHLSGVLPPTYLASDFVLNIDHTGHEGCFLLPPVRPAFPRLLILDLSLNDITAVLSVPPQTLQQVDLRGNQFTAAGLSNHWWDGGPATGAQQGLQLVNVQGNPALRLPLRLGTCHDQEGSNLAALTVDGRGWTRAGAGMCTSLCPRQVRVSFDFSAREDVVCRCSEGQGTGLDCRECPIDTYSVQSLKKGQDKEHYLRECHPCPLHSELRGFAGQCFGECSCREGYFMAVEGSEEGEGLGSTPCRLLEANASGVCRSCGIWKTSINGSRKEADCVCNGKRWKGLLQEGRDCRCPDGERMDFAESSCVKCDVAEDCTDWTKSLFPPAVKAGFWALPPPPEGDDGTYGNFSKHDIWRCVSSEACPGSNISCGWNRTGTACSLCKRGFFRAPSGSCSRCPQAYTDTRLVLLGALAASTVFHLAAHGLLSADSSSRGIILTLRSFRTSLKQVLKFGQILGVVSFFQVQWPEVVLSFFEVIRFLSFDLASWAGVACLDSEQQQSVTLELGFRWTIPAIGAAVTALSALLANVCGLCCLRRRQRQGESKMMKLLRRLSNFRTWEVLRVLVFFLQLFYTAILNNAVIPLSCAPSPNGHYTMGMFPHVICWNSHEDASFWPLALMGAIFTGLLIMGFPALVYRLYKRFDRMVDHQIAAVVETTPSTTEGASGGWWSFVFEDFRPDCARYVLVILCKDILLNLVTVLMPGLGTSQLLVTAGVSTSYAWLIYNAKPYYDMSNTLLEACASSAVAILCIFSAGMGFQSEPQVLDISSYLDEGRNNPVYLQRALTLTCLQGLSLFAPAVIITYQVLSTFERTRRCIPRRLLPPTEEQLETWRRDLEAMPLFVDQLDEVVVGSLHQAVRTCKTARCSLRTQGSGRSSFKGDGQPQAKPQADAPAEGGKGITQAEYSSKSETEPEPDAEGATFESADLEQEGQPTGPPQGEAPTQAEDAGVCSRGGSFTKEAERADAEKQSQGATSVEPTRRTVCL